MQDDPHSKRKFRKLNPTDEIEDDYVFGQAQLDLQF